MILDEPSNGLDPAGIREVRELVRGLGAEGRTVFLSSHLLGEVEQVCDRVAILSRGRTIVAGSVHDVLARNGPAAMWVKVADRRWGADACDERHCGGPLGDRYGRVAAERSES